MPHRIFVVYGGVLQRSNLSLNSVILGEKSQERLDHGYSELTSVEFSSYVRRHHFGGPDPVAFEFDPLLAASLREKFMLG